MATKLYAIEVKRDCRDDDYVVHHEFDHEPSREEIVNFLTTNHAYNDKYHDFDFYEVK